MEGMRSYASVAGWAVDFVKAARERPLWARLLLRLALGRYAYRELAGLVTELKKQGFVTNLPYELEGTDYHRDAIPPDIKRVTDA